MAKPKVEEPMAKNRVLGRVEVDKEAAARIKRIADSRDCKLQRQYGIIIERIALLAREKPDVIKELDLFNPVVTY